MDMYTFLILQGAMPSGHCLGALEMLRELGTIFSEGALYHEEIAAVPSFKNMKQIRSFVGDFVEILHFNE